MIDLSKLTGPPPTITKLGKPSAAQKVANFAGAAARHLEAGRPQATDEQVAERFAICQGCELYQAKSEVEGVCNHRSCGCKLKQVGVTGLNQLRWADQFCPLKKWGAVTVDHSKEESP